MDSKLKEILKEERRRQETKREHHRSDREHHKSDKEHHKHRSDRHRSKQTRSDKSKRKESNSIEYVTVNTQSEIEKFMFVYEDKDGNLFPKLESIPQEEDYVAKIFPVYVHGHNTNLTEEEITFKEGKWVPSNPPEDPEATWLNIKEDEMMFFEGTDVVVSNNLFFNSEDDLIDYIKDFGADYLPVKN